MPQNRSAISFKIKAVNFTTLCTPTKKGMQAITSTTTTTTTSHVLASSDRAFGLNGGGSGLKLPLSSQQDA
jgi:hypothetical protein